MTSAAPACTPTSVTRRRGAGVLGAALALALFQAGCALPALPVRPAGGPPAVSVPAPRLAPYEQRPAPELSAEAALVVDAASGRVLLERAADVPRPIASTTKIMTALVALEQVPAAQLDEPFAVGAMEPRPWQTLMGLRSGERVTARELLYGVMLPSGNDAADALAVRVAGSVEAFVELMNARAASLGLGGTRFANPSGLDQEGNYSTARDLATLAAVAMRRPDFAQVAGERVLTLPRLDPLPPAALEANPEINPHERTLVNQNVPIHYYPGMTGVKPGWTPEAGTCQVVSVTLDGRSAYVVLLNTDPPARDMVRLLDWVFGTTSELAPPDHDRTTVRGVSPDGQPWIFYANTRQFVRGGL